MDGRKVENLLSAEFVCHVINDVKGEMADLIFHVMCADHFSVTMHIDKTVYYQALWNNILLSSLICLNTN